MRNLIIVATVALVAANANAHSYTEHGTVTLLTEDQVGLGLGSLIESLAPGAIPNGVIWYVVNGVQGGDVFTITADDGQEPQVIGLADECPGPAWVGPTIAAAQAGDVDGVLFHAQNMWLVCNLIPDFDVYFTGGAHSNGPGNEAGTVPGSGAAVVVLYEGDPGEAFTYTEA